MLRNPTSLRGSMGHRHLGDETGAFPVLAAEAGFTWWQVLPRTPRFSGTALPASVLVRRQPLLISPRLSTEWSVTAGEVSKAGIPASGRSGGMRFFREAEVVRLAAERALKTACRDSSSRGAASSWLDPWAESPPQGGAEGSWRAWKARHRTPSGFLYTDGAVPVP